MRAHTLEEEIKDHWEENVKEQWRQNKKQISERLAAEFGSHQLERKLSDFVALGAKPFSIIAHHNVLFSQVRHAFVQGAYYPALTGSCALGERILNHLVIDLRDEFKGTPDYKRVYNKESFNNWQLAIGVLEAWGILDRDASRHFGELEKLRQRSIHFDPKIVTSLRDEALKAVQLVRDIVALRFGIYGPHPWMIPGTKGHAFIKEA